MTAMRDELLEVSDLKATPVRYGAFERGTLSLSSPSHDVRQPTWVIQSANCTLTRVSPN